MSPGRPSLSVVVPVFNRADVVERCLAALLDQRADSGLYEILVVDDGSQDATPRLLARMAQEHPFRIAVRTHARNQGLSAARNTGWRQSRAPLVLFLDCDLIATPDLVTTHLSAHERYPQTNVAVLGHVAYPADADRTPLLDFGNQVVKMWEGLARQPARPLDWRFFFGGHLSLKKTLLQQHGGFNEHCFAGSEGFEDWELGLRLAREARLVVRYAPQAVAYHYHWREAEAVLANARAYGFRLALWTKADPNHPVFREIPWLASLSPSPPPMVAAKEAARRTVVNRVSAPLLQRLASALSSHWPRAAVFLYRRLQKHAMIEGFRQGCSPGVRP